MVYRPNVDDKLCFVLMPFGIPFDSYYQKIIKPAAADAGLATLRSDEIRGRRAIIRDIWERVWAARIVVADVTGRNANVNYELGICDALGVPTIIISARIEDAPFDYKHRRIIVYERDEAGWDDKLRAHLTDTMRIVLAETSNEDEFEWPYDTGVLKESASGRVLIASADSRQIVIRGARIVRDAIASAFGPRGAAVAISHAFGATRQAQRGSQIAQGIKSSNPLEEKGIEQIRLAASTIYDSEGDCSKLVSILASGFMTRGQELIDKGIHPMDVISNFEHAMQKVLNHLNRESKPSTEKGIGAVATTAANGDKRIGELVSQAMKRVGKNGIITIETNDQSMTSLEVREGMQFDRGYLSEYFITNAETLECILDSCFILLYRGRIQSMKDLLPVLEIVAKPDKSILIVADDVEGEALATLTVNKIQGILRCAAVRAPGEGDNRKALMEDIAVLTGATCVGQEVGVPLTHTNLRHLGKAERVRITTNETTIMRGAGSSESVKDRISSLQTQISNAANPFHKEKLQERLARMAGSIAVLKAGGVSEGDILQEKYKLECALFSAHSAVEHGTVTGGGIGLLRAGMALRAEEGKSELQSQGQEALASLLEEPVRQLIENAGKSPTLILGELTKSDSSFLGFNVESGEIEDLQNSGVLDAVAPIERSLRVALSHAAAVLQTGTWDLSPPPTPRQ